MKTLEPASEADYTREREAAKNVFPLEVKN
jgi:hypothetical protein